MVIKHYIYHGYKAFINKVIYHGYKAFKNIWPKTILYNIPLEKDDTCT